MVLGLFLLKGSFSFPVPLCILFTESKSLIKLTHAECVRLGQAGPDLHLIFRALSARLTGTCGTNRLREGSRAAGGAHSVSHRATLPYKPLTTIAFGARCAQAVRAQKEVAFVTFTLCVLSGRAWRESGNTVWTPSTWKARAKVFRWGKSAYGKDYKLCVKLGEENDEALETRWIRVVTLDYKCLPSGHGAHVVSFFPHSTFTSNPGGHRLQHSPDSVNLPLAQAFPRVTYSKRDTVRKIRYPYWVFFKATNHTFGPFLDIKF